MDTQSAQLSFMEGGIWMLRNLSKYYFISLNEIHIVVWLVKCKQVYT